MNAMICGSLSDESVIVFEFLVAIVYTRVICAFIYRFGNGCRWK